MGDELRSDKEKTMGRSNIPVAEKIEEMSILDEHGKVDPTLEPQIAPAIHRQMLRAMLLGRRFDERMLDLQRQGRIGTFPPIKGQEAAHIGSVIQLRDDDWLVPSFRETAAEIMRGRSLESILAYYNGFNEGMIIPPAQRDLPMAIPVASQILHGVGLAWAAKYRQTDEVVMTFFGDGATSEGDFHEGLNCAAVYQSPVIFICQNNQWAISVPFKKQTHTRTIAQKALAYGMPGIRVDGNDILAVYLAAREAIARARNGDGPTLIECVTYRLMMHTTADDPKRYRSDEEVALWQQKEPLIRYQRYLADKGIVSEAEFQTLENEIKQTIQAAVEHAEQQMAEFSDPFAMFDHLYAELPPHLQRQRQELQKELSNKSSEVGRG
jgi:pyruvate dehydrogenase E1 component alpha subunit